MTAESALWFPVSADALARAARIKLALFDVDGVLTDGRLYVDNRGEEYKAFHSRDGHGLKMLARNGVEIGIITGRRSQIVEHRARELGIRHVVQGALDKLPAYEALLAGLGLKTEQTAFMGDDIVDLPIMRRAGLAVACVDAHPRVLGVAHVVTPSAGGRGAARELCELLMIAQGTHATEMARYA